MDLQVICADFEVALPVAVRSFVFGSLSGSSEKYSLHPSRTSNSRFQYNVEVRSVT